MTKDNELPKVVAHLEVASNGEIEVHPCRTSLDQFEYHTFGGDQPLLDGKAGELIPHGYVEESDLTEIDLEL